MVSGRRWSRVLLLLLLAVCVIAMHSAPAVDGSRCLHAPQVAVASDVPEVGDQAGHPPQGENGPCGLGDHHILAVCLAVLVAVSLLGIGGVLLLGRIGRHFGYPSDCRSSSAPTPVRARPPPPITVRLAELCVLRC